MSTPIALQAEIARLREALANKHHDRPEDCPLWIDGCHCGEAFAYWKKRCKQVEDDFAIFKLAAQGEIGHLQEENRVLKLKLQSRADTKPLKVGEP